MVKIGRSFILLLTNWFVEGLAHLTFLERLNLSHNTITSLNSFSVGNLHHLQRLNIDNNQITTLEGLQVRLLC